MQLGLNDLTDLTHYSSVLISIPPENIRKPLGFLVFSGGIEKQHRAVMGLLKLEYH